MNARPRQVLLLALAALLVSAMLVSAAGAASVPPGPRLAAIRWILKPPSRDVITTGAGGAKTTSVVSASEGDNPVPALNQPQAFSPDGTEVVFSGVVGHLPRARGGFQQTRLFEVGADGFGLRPIPGTEEGYLPVFSPDGHTVAFTRKRRRGTPNGKGGNRHTYSANTAWLVDLASGRTRQLTPWRNHIATVPSSFAPDGTLAVTKKSPGVLKALAIDVATGSTSLLVDNAIDPRYSPDGSRVAFTRGSTKTIHRYGEKLNLIVTDTYVIDADGSDLRNLTATPTVAEVDPAWDPSGQRLAYIAVEGFKSLQGVGDAVMEINADGSCPTRILSSPNVAYSGTAWQPGPGRGIAPLVC